MRKFVILITLILLVGITTNAWSIPLVGYGVKAGVGIANASIDPKADTGEYKSISAIMLGGFVRFDLMPVLALQPEALIVIGKGVKYEPEQGDAMKSKINYLEIPVLLKYNIPSAAVKPSIFLGPALGIKLGASNDPEVKDQNDEVVDPEVKSTDFSLVVGADVQLPMGLLFDLRYTLGLTNVNDMEKPDPEPTGYEEPTAKNKNISIMIGYAF